MSASGLDGLIGVVVLVGLGWMLYRPRIQQSKKYQALVVPLANIMDVGFLVLSPIIVALVGFSAPFFMLGICLLAMAAGTAITYNIRHYEPLIGTGDSTEKIGALSNWMLLGASVVNIGYYTMLLMTLTLLPLQVYSENRVTTMSVIALVVLMLAGYKGYLPLLNRLGDRTTAFNITALVAVLAVFATYNLNQAISGNWSLPTYEPDVDAEVYRKIFGLFAMVQGFESARYIGNRFSGELRVSTMRLAQVIATIVFVALIGLVLLPFGQFQPRADATAIFVVSDQISVYLPWLILVAALGSQFSAITNATSSRSDLLMEATRSRLDKRFTFPLLLVPAILIVLFIDVIQAVSVASRVFAIFFTLQAVIAVMLAARNRNWAATAGFVIVGLMTSAIAVFGLPI